MSETYIQWRRRIEKEWGYKGVTFVVEERNGKVTAASIFTATERAYWPSKPKINQKEE